MTRYLPANLAYNPITEVFEWKLQQQSYPARTAKRQRDAIAKQHQAIAEYQTLTSTAPVRACEEFYQDFLRQFLVDLEQETVPSQPGTIPGWYIVSAPLTVQYYARHQHQPIVPVSLNRRRYQFGIVGMQAGNGDEEYWNSSGDPEGQEKEGQDGRAENSNASTVRELDDSAMGQGTNPEKEN